MSRESILLINLSPQAILQNKKVTIFQAPIQELLLVKGVTSKRSHYFSGIKSMKTSDEQYKQVNKHKLQLQFLWCLASLDTI